MQNSDKRNNLTVEQTIDKALEAGRISTVALRDEVMQGFNKRHQRAKDRWERIKPKKPLEIEIESDPEPYVATISTT